ncbi:hypothetical protein C8034_v000769 [Colletotrichum sidae]|uniref:DUF2423 domain-containing protein n=4 Tax=Colletotrichum orbiculare species complex TaxID=2707354 RepID=N4V7C1_COLOR|nr:hypothetical protein Cob_v002792 [Colletotrichum orbiculare MAFF 240422]TDZ27164.1 hypothetical protein C8035_v011984 [Colletotrichum spinosum]TDZ74373.1 hypothetical protein CTRI78_v000740 [Colletotrichum trifolii]TEA19339.1 hypothetical protein C8034_v000769 [Colletotrichum sidae]
MAKSARSSTKKNNNQRLKKDVFGPVEAERAERLSAKLLELAKQPKPVSEADVNMDTDEQNDAQASPGETKKTDDSSMEVDSAKPQRRRSGRIQKQKKTSKIVFPKYKDRRGGSKKKA